jgi:hypothetical protein
MTRSARRRLALALALAAPAPARAGVVPVATAAELVAAIDSAQPGDVITLAPGTYTLTQNLSCDVAGTPDAPIVVRAAALGAALIRFDALEGFKVSARHWLFENLDILGVCADHSDCEHAFHLFGDADFTRIRDCRVRDFNAQIKSNITGGLFPDDVVVERCEFGDGAPRQTSNPVTKIDVVGGRRWRVRANLLHDFEKALGDGISYAAFLKGNSRDGVFEGNLVLCERDHAGGVRLGLSLGGGGSAPGSICEDGTCTPEHQNGILRDNIVVACPADVGIYLNEAFNSRVHHNTLLGNTGIDVRFAASTADLRNNIVSGPIRERDGGSATTADNLTGVTLAQAQAWFADPLAGDLGLLDGTAFVDQGAPLALVPLDYCGDRRADGAADLGAVEYDAGRPCATTALGGGELFNDGFETGGTGLWSAAQR